MTISANALKSNVNETFTRSSRDKTNILIGYWLYGLSSLVSCLVYVQLYKGLGSLFG